MSTNKEITNQPFMKFYWCFTLFNSQGLLAANEEFAAEVERLYKVEENWEEKSSILKEDSQHLMEKLSGELNILREQLETQRKERRLDEERLSEELKQKNDENRQLKLELEEEENKNFRQQNVSTLKGTLWNLENTKAWFYGTFWFISNISSTYWN